MTHTCVSSQEIAAHTYIKKHRSKNCALLDYYTAGSINFLKTFQENPEEFISHLLRGGSPKSNIVVSYICMQYEILIKIWRIEVVNKCVQLS
jgi:hypothetical protein